MEQGRIGQANSMERFVCLTEKEDPVAVLQNQIQTQPNHQNPEPHRINETLQHAKNTWTLGVWIL